MHRIVDRIVDCIVDCISNRTWPRHRSRAQRVVEGPGSVVLAATLHLLLALPVATAHATVVPPPGHIYTATALSAETQSCIAAGPGGTFAGIGTGFTARGQAVVLVKESGETRLVAFGFNSLGDCVYDRARDVLYVTDNAGELDGASTGDTVFAIPSASTASGLLAETLALLPAGDVPNAASLAVLADGDVLVSDAAGGGGGRVLRIDLAGPPAASTFAQGFDFTAGLAVEPVTGDVLVAESRASFDTLIHRFTGTGMPLPTFAGPSFDYGSLDLAFDVDGHLLATGSFAGDVVAFDNAGMVHPFVSGLTFASGITADPFTGRVEILSSFSGTVEDRSLHRFVPVDRLLAAGTRGSSECLHEFYGLAQGSRPRLSTCMDGEACDADGIVNDRCLIGVGFCVNVADPALPGCTPAPLVGASVTSTPYAIAVADAGARLGARLPTPDPDCVFSDGVVVPVKITRQGRRPGTVALRVEVTTMSGAVDVDRMRVRCEPAP